MWAVIANTAKALRVYIRRLGHIFAFSHTTKSSTSEGIIADNSGSEMAYNFVIDQSLSHLQCSVSYMICVIDSKAGKGTSINDIQ